MKKLMLVSVLAIALVLGLAGVANAAVWNSGVLAPPVNNSANPVNVRATINPRVSLSISCPDATQTVDFGALNPGDAASKQVDITVRSNQAYHLQKAVATPAALTSLGCVMTYANGSSTAGAVTAGQTYNDVYSIAAVPWTTAPGSYNTDVTYTVVVP